MENWKVFKMNLTGDIIEESLDDKSIIKELNILNTRIEKVKEEHHTPHLTQWTLHEISVPENQADEIAEKLSRALESEHQWYADFKNDKTHYIIFKDKVFKIDRTNFDQYKKASDYGVSLGIPDYQVDFFNQVIK